MRAFESHRARTQSPLRRTQSPLSPSLPITETGKTGLYFPVRCKHTAGKVLSTTLCACYHTDCTGWKWKWYLRSVDVNLRWTGQHGDRVRGVVGKTHPYCWRHTNVGDKKPPHDSTSYREFRRCLHPTISWASGSMDRWIREQGNSRNWKAWGTPTTLVRIFREEFTQKGYVPRARHYSLMPKPWRVLAIVYRNTGIWFLGRNSV